MSVEASASPVIDASQEIGSASSAAAPDTANPPVDAPEPKQLTGDELMSTLRTQIEFYFSQQNLASDTFLLSKMNADKYVPVDVIAGFKKVKALTTDRDLVLQAMGKCQNCELDETNTMVRPAKSTSRDTLILRDIPKDTPTDEVKDIFSFAGAGEIVDIRPDIEDTWFVKFKSEEDCQKTALSLFGKTFKGKPVRARVKAAHTVRGFYQQPSRPNPNAGAFRPQQQQQWQGNGYYYGAGAGAGVSAGAAGAAYGAYGMGGYGQWTDASQYGAQGKGRGRGQSAFGAMQANSPQVLPGAPGDGKKKKKKNKARNAAAPAGKPGQGRAGGRTGRPPLGPENFPALPTAKRASGYNRSFTKFSRESMADIAAKLSEQGFERPAGMPGPADCLAIREKPRLGTQLMKPFPIMYPASPSPMLQPQPKEVLEHGMPALDLGPKESPTSQSAMQRPTSAWVPMGAKALVGGGIHAALQNRTRSVVQAGSGAAPAAPSEKPAPAAAPAVAKKTEAKSEAPAAAVSPSTSSPPVKPATPAAPASQAVAPAAKTSSGTSNDTNVKKLPSYADLLRKK